MKKTFLVALLTMALMFCFSGGLFAADSWDGTTKDTSWYSSSAASFEISTPAQLAGLASIVNAGTDTFANKTVKLTANLDLGGIQSGGTWDEANSKNWTPIGDTATAAKQFAGVFDGNGKTVSNLYINATTQYQGLFGYVAAAGRIKNLAIASGYVKSTVTDVGGIAGYCYGYIMNCSNAATVIGGGNVGGIAGSFGGSGWLLNSFNTGDVKGTGTSVRYVGGLVANFSSSGTIQNCYNLGNLSDFGLYGGGLVAQTASGSIINCYNVGTVTASSTTYVANLIGRGHSTMTKFLNIYGLKTATVNASLPAMANPAGTTLETTALKDGTALAGLASTLGSNFKAPSGSATYPQLIWENGGSYPTDEIDGLAIGSASVENGKVTVVMNKALGYTTLDKAQFALTAVINEGASNAITVNSASQSNNVLSTTVTLNYTAITAGTANKSVAVSVSYFGGSAVAAGTFNVAPSTEWPAYGVAPASGSGTVADPYLLASPENLAWFASEVNGGKSALCARLTADIDLNGKTWIPIGTSTYIGVFDGNGHVIKNLTANSSDTGLFGYIKAGGLVKNLGIASGTVTGTSNAGGISGRNAGVILSCFNNAAITSNATGGGLAGACPGGKIISCYNSGSINAKTAGGITGTVTTASGTVMNVYNIGKVTSTATPAGGIAGSLTQGIIQNAYNTGDVVAVGAAPGGILGTYNSGTVSNCNYLQTSVTSNQIDGTSVVSSATMKTLASTLGSGFVADSGSINSGYPVFPWQVTGNYPADELEGLAITSVRAENGKVYVTLNKKLTYRTLVKGDFSLEMRLAGETYDTASITAISTDNSGEQSLIILSFDPYGETTATQTGFVKVAYQGNTAVEGALTIAPSLEWKLYDAGGFASGDGSESNPYQIANEAQLVYLSNQVALGVRYEGKHFILTADLQLGEKYWYPIGSYGTTDLTALPFAGNFDGQNHTLHNLYIPFNGTSGVRYSCSGVFGWNTGNISNLKVTGLIQGNESGGIVARNDGTVTNCVNYTNLQKYAYSSSSPYYYVGGITGYNRGNIIGCLNYGNINSASTQLFAQAGGIAGYVDASLGDLTISRCANYGTIIGYSNLGGITSSTAGNSKYNITISECFNAGQIVASATRQSGYGGIVGSSSYNTTISNCYNTSDIAGMTSSSSTAGSGGITGGKGGHLINCYDAGSLGILKNCGAHIMGSSIADYTSISNCYYLNDGFHGGVCDISRIVVDDSYSVKALDAKAMQSAAFVAQLNGGDGTAYVADSTKVNNGYPVLAWAADQENTAPSGLKGGENKITGLDVEKRYEYKNINSTSYTAVTAGSKEITGLDCGSYNVRLTESAESAPSAYATVNVSGEPKGTATIFGVGLFNNCMYKETCYAFAEGLPLNENLSYQWFRYNSATAKYTRISGATDRLYTPKAKDIGCYLYVEIYVDGCDGLISATSAAAVVKYTVSSGGFTTMDCSTEGNNDGKITGLNPDLPYEYKLSSDSNYTAVAGGATEITGLAPGVYNLRGQTTDLYTSSATNYTINDFATSLANAKTAARTDLSTALAAYKEADYSADNWTALNTAKTGGDTAIDAAATLADVTAAKKNAIDAMAAVRTAIVVAKEDAHSALTTAFTGYKESNYYAYQWILLNKAKTDGDTAIDAAADTAAVGTAEQTAIDAMAAVKTKATLDAANVSTTVSLDAQANNGFLVPYQTVTVSATLAEGLGYSDTVDADQSVSALDVLVKAHQLCYGDQFDGSQLKISGNGIVKIFDVVTSNCGFAVNGASPHSDTLNESSWGNYYDGYGINQAKVSDNDKVEFFLYQDDWALDNYAWFEQSGTKVDQISAKAGTDFSLSLKGYAIGWYGCSEASEIASKTAAIEGAHLAIVAADGKLTDIKNAVSDENGNVTLKVSKEGSYFLTAYIPADDMKDGATPIMLPIAALSISAGDTVVDVKNMTDVKSTDWFYDSVSYVLAHGIMNGTSATTFDPNGNITRGQFVTVLGRYAGIVDSTSAAPTTTKFKDVDSSAYYAAHVAWAAEKGITTGTAATTFDPNANISRQDMAVMMARFAKVMEIGLPDGSNATAFADDKDIADYAKTAVYSMAEAKIINGVSTSKFAPKATATRAQAAKMMTLLVTYVK